MKFENEYESDRKRRHRRHSSPKPTPYLGLDPYHGVPIQCQFCSGKDFRRSSLRSEDFSEILLMRYPVRCLRCGQRQMVSYTIASLAISSSIKPRRRHRPVDPSKRWIDFTKHPDAPNPLVSAPMTPTQTEEESHSGR
jgi:hypothetical protein